MADGNVAWCPKCGLRITVKDPQRLAEIWNACNESADFSRCDFTIEHKDK